MCISTLRLIRPVDEAPTKEVLKEFFRLIGCLCCDRPVHSLVEAKNELRERNGAEIDIVLNIEPEFFYYEKLLSESVNENSLKIKKVRLADRNSPTVFVNYEIPDTGKKELYHDMIGKLISQIWGAAENEKDSQSKQLQEINDLYFKLDLLGFLQCKRAFRVVNMGEVLEISLCRHSIPASDYIGKMLVAFNELYCGLSEIKERKSEPVSVYVRYARVNIARKIRETFNILEKLPPVHEGENQSVTYCSAAFLLSELGELYQQDNKYLGSLFLAAYVCQGEPSQELNASFYYRQLFEELSRKDQRSYSFAYYEYGRYIEKVEKNWDRAILYYKKAVELDSLGYRAWFKIACHEAKSGNFIAAKEGFLKVIYIISDEFSGAKETTWENLSLRSIQYMFKAYMWLWKIAMADSNYSVAMVYLHQAKTVAGAYMRNECLERAYDADSSNWIDLKTYHESSEPVRLLYHIVNSRLENDNR